MYTQWGLSYQRNDGNSYQNIAVKTCTMFCPNVDQYEGVQGQGRDFSVRSDPRH